MHDLRLCRVGISDSVRRAISCAVNCVALITHSLFDFIPRIFAIFKTTTGRTLRLRLKIDFDTDRLNAKHNTAFLYNIGRAGRK